MMKLIQPMVAMPGSKEFHNNEVGYWICQFKETTSKICYKRTEKSHQNLEKNLKKLNIQEIYGYI